MPSSMEPLLPLPQPPATAQDENQDAGRAQQALQERLVQLQHLCLELDRQPLPGSCSSAGGGEAGGAGTAAAGEGGALGSRRQAELLERLSCTLRALGPANGSPLVALAATGPRLPPPVAPGKVRLTDNADCTVPPSTVQLLPARFPKLPPCTCGCR